MTWIPQVIFFGRRAPHDPWACTVVRVDFAVNQDGEVVIHKAKGSAKRKPDRFEAARGKADVKWRTHDLMALLRDDAENGA